MFTVRLVGSNSSHEGRLELFQYGFWGKVCDNGFTDSAAAVVCRSLRLGLPYVLDFSTFVVEKANDANVGLRVREGKAWVDCRTIALH